MRVGGGFDADRDAQPPEGGSGRGFADEVLPALSFSDWLHSEMSIL